jgi:hypothetical protein
MPNIYGVTIECGIEIDTSSLSASDIADIQSGTYDGTLVLEADSDIGFGYYHIPYGVFIVESCPRSHGAMWHRKVTAYSVQPIDDTNAFGGVLNSTVPFKNIKLTMPVMNAALGVNNLASTDITFTNNNSDFTGTFYGANRHKYQVAVDNLIPKRWYVPNYTDFVHLEFTDEQNYKNFGKCIAEMIDNAGVDILCDSTGAQIFESTEEALKAYLPVCFAPCVLYQSATLNGEVLTYDGRCSFNTLINSGSLTPVFQRFNRGVISDSAMTGTDRFYTADIIYYYASSPELLRIEVFDTTASTTSYITYTPTEQFPTLPEFTCTVTNGKRYYQATEETPVLEIGSTLTVQNSVFIKDTKVKTVGYTYANAFSWSKAVDGILELNAQFGRYSRTGEFERMNLDRSNPIQISASEYSEVWWDDYSIDGVGLITYRFGNNDTVAYSIGGGGSEYDMTSNYLLEHYVTDDTETAVNQIQALLDTYFVPKLDNLSYLPSDGTLIGLPYLEAGDYIEIATGAGDTIGTYILTRTISGIQTLTDSIESKGGEVMGNGS